MRINVSRYMLIPALVMVFMQPARLTAGNTQTLSGTVEVVHVDGIDNKKSEFQYFINQGNQQVPLRMEFKGAAPNNLIAGSKVNIHGQKNGHVFQVEQIDVQATTTGSTSPSTSGSTDVLATAVVERKAVTLLVNMKNGVNSAGTVSAVSGDMYDNTSSMAGQYDASSYGQLSFKRDTDGDGKADVFGPFTIDADATASCDYYDWAYKAEAAAKSAGIDLTKYQHKVFVLPSYTQLTQCGWAGVGNLACGDSCRAWVAYNWKGIYSHELGHNLAMHHAGVDSDNNGVLESEYGDGSSIMGSAAYANQFNAPNKVQLGWMAAFTGSVLSVNGVGNNSFSLSALELDRRTQNPDIQVLTHPRAAGGNYYISFRQTVGNYGAQSDYANKVSVHSYDGGSTQTRLIKALVAGEQFTDANSGFSVSYVGSSADGLTAEVAISSIGSSTTSCSPSAPSFSISPANQTGLPGSQFAYNLTVKNNDSSSCSATTFNLAASTGSLTSSLSAASLSLTPGTSSTSQLKVTSSATNSDGLYLLTASVQASNHSSVSGNGSVSLDGTAPTTPSNLIGTLKRGVVTLSWSGSTDNLSGVAPYRVLRNGVMSATTSTTSFSDRNLVAGTTYTYQVYAVDKAGNVSAASNSFSITLASLTGKSRK
jgi:hypothetical protein